MYYPMNSIVLRVCVYSHESLGEGWPVVTSISSLFETGVLCGEIV